MFPADAKAHINAGIVRFHSTPELAYYLIDQSKKALPIHSEINFRTIHYSNSPGAKITLVASLDQIYIPIMRLLSIKIYLCF